MTRWTGARTSMGSPCSSNKVWGPLPSVVKVGQAVQQIINLLRDYLLDADLVHADETAIQVLK